MAKLREGNLTDLGSATAGTAQNISDLENVYISIAGTFVATVKVQVSHDGGTNWVDFDSKTAPALVGPLPPCGRVRTNATAWTSGTIKSRFGGDQRAL